MAGPNSSFLDPLLSPTHQDNGVDLPRRANINLIGFSVADNPTTDATDITNTGSGGGGTIALADHAAFRALSSPPADGTVINFKNPIGTFVYSSTEGSGQADDDKTILKLTSVSSGSNGRAYSTDGPILPTIAALRLAVSGKQSTIHVQAYATGGDGGGGIFDDVTGVLSTADDGGVFIHAGSRVFKRRNDSTIDVRWYGIFPDSTGAAANNTTRFNALMALLASGGGHGLSVHAPRGTYYFARGTTLLIHDISGMRLFGDGRDATQFQMGIDNTGSIAHIPFVDIVGCFDCHFENMTFFAMRQGSSGGVDGIGTSSVDYVARISSKGLDSSEHFGCARNVFEHVRFQGGAIAGMIMGSGAQGIGNSSNLDQNLFIRCAWQHNDGYGLIVSDTNTDFTHFFHCSAETNGLEHVHILGCKKVTFTRCAYSNPGILDGDPHHTIHGYDYLVDNCFAFQLTIEQQLDEFQNHGLIKTLGESGGVPALGQIIIRDFDSTNNNASDWTDLIHAKGSHAYYLHNCRFLNNVSQTCQLFFNADSGTSGPRSIFTENVTLVGSTTTPVALNVTNFIWDGSGVISMANIVDTAPTVSRITITNTDFSSLAGDRLAGSKVNPNFGSQDLVAHNSTFSGQQFGSGTGADQIQRITRGHSSQTANIEEWQNSAAAIKLFIDAAYGFETVGALTAAGANSRVRFMSYTADASYGGAYIGIGSGSEGSTNFLFISNGANALWNAPNAAGEHGFYCGFAGRILRLKGTDANPEVLIGNGTTIKGHLSGTATLSFGTITALTSAEQDITVTGAAVGDVCYATPQANPGANASWSAYVKTADKVTVRVTAVATDVTTDVVWRADVWKH